MNEKSKFWVLLLTVFALGWLMHSQVGIGHADPEPARNGEVRQLTRIANALEKCQK